MITNTIGENTIIRTSDLEELQALVKRQRVIIEMYNEASKRWFGEDSYWPDETLANWERKLKAAYEAAQDTSTMTGASEQ